MKGILSLLRSRKAWITLFGIITTLSGGKFGLPPEQLTLIAGLFAVLVIAIMGEDVAKYLKVNLPDDTKKKEKQ